MFVFLTFVASDVCRFRRLSFLTFVVLTFVVSDICRSDVCRCTVKSHHEHMRLLPVSVVDSVSDPGPFVRIGLIFLRPDPDWPENPDPIQ